jgi:hypothetical protein
MNDDTRSKEIFDENISLLPSSVMEIQKTIFARMDTLAVAQEHALQREFERKTKKFGKDSDEVKALESRIATEKLFHIQLHAQAQRADVTIPERRADRFILHGRLVDSEGLGISGLIVNGIDSCTKKILDHSSTDQNGYFKLAFYCVSERLENAEPIITDKTRVEEKGIEFTLEVMDKDQNILYRDDKTYTLIPGSLVYKEIMIKDESK